MSVLVIGATGFIGPRLIRLLARGDDFPQGDKSIRKEDHQAFIRQFIFAMRGGKHRILEVIPKEKTVFPAACKFA